MTDDSFQMFFIDNTLYMIIQVCPEYFILQYHPALQIPRWFKVNKKAYFINFFEVCIAPNCIYSGL